ncbi:MAG: hypothetical protein ACC707_12325 [Thiohalomonadales bacterium]
MKKIIVLCLICFSPTLWATEARVNTLGGEIAMLPKDDANIDLFPQAINEWELVRISNIGDSGAPASDPGYAVLLGESGDKWGIYGGSTEVNDFVNVYRSLGKNKAIKLGVTLSTDKTKDPTVETEYSNIGFNFVFGMDKGDTEYAYTLAYNKDPILSPGCTSIPNVDGTCGKSTPIGGGASISKKYNNFSARFDMRTPKKLAIFDTLYANAVLVNGSQKYDGVAGGASQKTTIIGGEVLVFKQIKFGEKDLLVYGLGFALNYVKTSGDVGVTSIDNKQLALGGPRIRVGLEKDIKYGVFRFGIYRTIDFYYSNKNESGGNTSDTSGFGQRGNYAITTGWGFNYKKLQIDVILTDNFWSSGPQLIFDGSQGPLSARTDIRYSF